MAPMPSAEKEPPLADYFFIAGFESSQVFDEKTLASRVASPAPTSVETTIEENEVLETDTAKQQSKAHSKRLSKSLAKPLSTDALPVHDEQAPKSHSRPSHEARKSASSIIGSDALSASNRSSATIRHGPLDLSSPPSPSPTTLGPDASCAASPPSRHSPTPDTALNEVDFDNALRKFAAERESFLEEIHFSAGTIPQMTKPKKKTLRILSGDDLGAIKSGVGSLRRRLSTMNSLKRQPSILRQCTFVSPFASRRAHHLQLPSVPPSASAVTIPSSPSLNLSIPTPICIRLSEGTNPFCLTDTRPRTWSMT